MRRGWFLFWVFRSEGGATFRWASRAGICKGTFGIVSTGVLWSVWGSCRVMWGPPLPSVTRHSGWWPSTVTPSIDQALRQFLTLLLILTLLPNSTFYLIVRGFHRTFATGAACQQRTLTPPDTWSCPTLGLACVLMSRPISLDLVLSPDFWISNIPRYFSFAYSSGHLVLSHFGTCKCSNVETNISWTYLVSGLLSFEHSSVLLFLL